jgi:hypothetical protein
MGNPGAMRGRRLRWPTAGRGGRDAAATRALSGALAGFVAAQVYVCAMPVDKGLVGYGYDDVQLVGKLFSRDRRAWPALGLLGNSVLGSALGAAGGLAWPFLPGPAWLRGLAFAQGDHAMHFAFSKWIDRAYPPIRRGDHPRL